MVHLIEENILSNGIPKLMLSTIVFEVNMVENSGEWFIDGCTIHHIFADKEMFSSYTLMTQNHWFR